MHKKSIGNFSLADIFSVLVLLVSNKMACRKVAANHKSFL